MIVTALVWLNRMHQDLREARGLEDHGQTALEAVMTVSAGLALVGFGAWFFLFSGGSSPAADRPGRVSSLARVLRPA